MRHVDEAVAHPGAADDLVRDLIHQLEGGLDAVLVDRGAARKRRGHRVLVVPEDVEGVGGRQDEVRPVLGPDHEPGHDVDAPDQPVLRPVVEADEVAAADADEAAAVELVHHEGRFEGEALLEVLEDRDLPGARAVPRGVGTRVAPGKLQRLAKGLVPQRLGRVDHKLAVAADREEPAVGVVRDVLREDLGGAHVPHAQGDALAVPDRCALVDELEVRGLDLVALGKDDLARMHRGHRLLAAELDDHGALVVANGRSVGAVQCRDGPDTL
mmetsp:Transcript_62374/g.193183  ORF Transcript_62374/g.193183 Transcript_62374/m.193183 type:complete len:270 (-) Transcript_62374:895-1704(-)